jgi:hypothetical protein
MNVKKKLSDAQTNILYQNTGIRSKLVRVMNQ